MIGRVTAGAVIVAAITFLGYRVLPINANTQGFLYLIAILFLATGWGLTEAIVASFVAVLCFNYFFFPPVGTFTTADPQNWVALAAFLITAITASRLSAQELLKDRGLLDEKGWQDLTLAWKEADAAGAKLRPVRRLLPAPPRNERQKPPRIID
jgi:K+-sensing histidine kinase KdpD